MEIDLQVGDRVEVEWGHRIGIVGVKGDCGVVEWIGLRFVSIRHPSGYIFSVADYDITSGTEIIVKERAKMAEAIDYIVAEGADWRDILTREKYLQLKKDGLTDRKIAAACRISTKTLTAWKQGQGLVGVRLDAGGKLIFPVDEQAAARELEARTQEMRAKLLGEDDESEPEAATPAEIAKAANELQAQVEAAVGSGSAMTVVDAVQRVEALEHEITCSSRMLKHCSPTNAISDMIAKHRDRCQQELDRVKNAQVVI